MKNLLITLAGASVLLAPLPVLAGNSVSAQTCRAWFNRVDRNNDGSIGTTENARVYFDKITLGGSGKASDDQHIMQKAFFLRECAIGSFGKPSKP